MYLIVPFIPGIVAIFIAVIKCIKRLGYTKVKAAIMTRERAVLKKSSSGKLLYIATYVYENDGIRVENKNEKIMTTAKEWEYIYLDNTGEIADNQYNRYSGAGIFGIVWIIAVYFVLQSGIIG